MKYKKLDKKEKIHISINIKIYFINIKTIKFVLILKKRLALFSKASFLAFIESSLYRRFNRK